MITITKLEQQFKDNKPSGYKINLSDGTWGYLVEKDSDKELKEGDSVTFTAETPNGKSYKKLTVHKEISTSGTAPQPNNPTPQPKSNGYSKGLIDLKAEANIKAMGFMVDAFIADKITYEQIKEKHKELTGYLYDAIDEAVKG